MPIDNLIAGGVNLDISYGGVNLQISSRIKPRAFLSVATLEIRVLSTCSLQVKYNASMRF